MPDSLLVWNVLVVAMVVVVFLLPIAALFSIWRWRDHMETTHVLLWAAIVIFAPLLGSIVWFVAGEKLHAENAIALPARSAR